MKHDTADLKSSQRIKSVGFLCLEGSPLDQLSVALRYLNSANKFETGALFHTQVVSLTGGEIECECGLSVRTSALSVDHSPFQYLFVFGGISHQAEELARLRTILRRHLGRGSVVAVIENAVLQVANTGVLDQADICATRQVQTILAERFSEVNVLDQPHCTTGNLWSAVGQFALLNLISNLVTRSAGQRVEAELARCFFGYRHSSIVDGDTQLLASCLGQASTGDRIVDDAIEVFRDNLETPLLMQQVAQLVGISVRQLERKFLVVTGLSPKAYYLAERLERADMMIRGTNLPMLEIALACGFGSYSSFSQRFRKSFGQTPIRRRMAARNG